MYIIHHWTYTYILFYQHIYILNMYNVQLCEKSHQFHLSNTNFHYI